MVEGHSVHRVAASHRQKLVGKAFKATSPNGRFAEGAKTIDGLCFASIEAVGKNLFAFFEDPKRKGAKGGEKGNGQDQVVVHVHFGMAGAWAVFDQGKGEAAPPPSKTNRLRLEGHGLVADLSAMTVGLGTFEGLYLAKRAALGEDPLRADADPNRLWSKVSKSSKSIGALLMDQSHFAGPGNIYRAEILFKASVHPLTPGRQLSRHEFDSVWRHTVELLNRGYQTGSILTVDAADVVATSGKAALRRYIYNSPECGRCSGPVMSWDLAGRTCYACERCQPVKPHTAEAPAADAPQVQGAAGAAGASKPAPSTPRKPSATKRSGGAATKRTAAESGVATPAKAKAEAKTEAEATEVVTKKRKGELPEPREAAEGAAAVPKVHRPFNSHCAREPVAVRLARGGGALLTVKELKLELAKLGVKLGSSGMGGGSGSSPPRKADLAAALDAALAPKVDALSAAREKARAGESRAVEHIAELAPSQARRAAGQAAKNTCGPTSSEKSQ